ncbi:hypothetical protein [Paenibacillus sp. AN1007]|uniref:Uncharacterized protein n=1 Tax=Paenibacillus sp. AN1007 TaxID=3151385 RepID=A0AAU8NFZ9_9BACL
MKKSVIIPFTALSILLMATFNQVSADNNDCKTPKDVPNVKTSSHGGGGW